MAVKAFDPVAFRDRLTFAIGQAMNRQRMGKQGELAVRLSALTKIDIGQPAVSRWTSGSRPSMEHLAALADLAGVDAGWLAVGALSEAPVPESYITPPTVKRTGQRKPPPGGGAEQKRA